MTEISGSQNMIPEPTVSAASGNLLEIQILRSFSYLQTGKIYCCGPMDAGRRRKSPRSETKDFISHCIESVMNFMLTLVPLTP